MSWQLVTTVPNAETKVARMLSCLDFDHRIYRFRRKIPRNGRIVDQLAPLFPRYIFVKALKCWETVRSITGVVDFVREGKDIAEVRSSELSRLAEMSDADHVVKIDVFQGKFQPGEKIRITGMNSLVFGLNGVYQYPVGVDRAYVLLPWFNGQLIGTVVDERDVEKEEPVSRKRMTKRRRRNRRRRSKSCYIQPTVVGA